MDLFNKKFFRLAFGFVAIILISVAIIVVTNSYETKTSSNTNESSLGDHIAK